MSDERLELPGVSFRLGAWQDVLRDVDACDVVLTDPPYSERTHAGFRSMTDYDPETIKAQEAKYGFACRNRMNYESISEDQMAEFAAWCVGVSPSWCAVFGDHRTFNGWAALFDGHGWMTFAPVVWLKTDAPPRMAGEGPASSAEYICVARPRRAVREHASRSGYYLVNTHKSPLPPDRRVVGMKKPRDLRRVIEDYTRPGDLVVDPFAGTATVGQACIETGRRYIGSEIDPRTYALGVRRLRGSTPPLPGTEPDRWREGPRVEQSTLFGDGT